MAVRELRLEELESLDDGRVVAAFNQALKRAARDCEDRPGEEAVRKVTLQCEIKPLMSESGDLEDVEVSFQIKDTVPTRKTKKYTCAYRRLSQGTNLVFNDMSDENPNQHTLDEGNQAFE